MQVGGIRKPLAGLTAPTTPTSTGPCAEPWNRTRSVIYETLRARARERDVSAAKTLLQKHGIAIQSPERRCPRCSGRLPSVEGYTIDERLREFRKVEWKGGDPAIEFVPFESEQGGRLLEKFFRGVR